MWRVGDRLDATGSDGTDNGVEFGARGVVHADVHHSIASAMAG